MICGVIPIDKPEGFTSFDVIAKCRGILKERHLGHSGTLDPMATGVLPVFIGRATKAIDLLPDNEKRYAAGFKLGFSTDTQDVTGETLKTSSVRVTREDVEQAIPKFVGKISQLPPMYSAVKVDGKRLYDLARAGKTVERTPRQIEIFSLKLTDFDEGSQSGGLEISCSKGTYIRTLINDLGETLGTLGVMTSLQRTYSQGFDIADCISLEQLESAVKSGGLDDMIVPIEQCFGCYPEIRLDEKLERLYRNGVKLEKARVGNPEDGRYRVYGKEFLGLGTVEKGVFKVLKNFTGDSNE